MAFFVLIKFFDFTNKCLRCIMLCIKMTGRWYAMSGLKREKSVLRVAGKSVETGSSAEDDSDS